MKRCFLNIFVIVLIFGVTTNTLWAGPFDDESVEKVQTIKTEGANTNKVSNTIKIKNSNKSLSSTEKGSNINKIQMYLTDPSAKIYLTKQETPKIGENAENLPEITIDSSERFQTIDGFGFALTGGSAYLLNKMSVSDRSNVLKRFYDPKVGIGASMVRISIGASDLSQKCFTYDEKLLGLGKDTDLKKFNIYAGDKEVIPMLKEILAINPDIKILATPWTAPKWMKSNKLYGGGSLKPKFYQAYADYFVKYLKTMKENGINISAISTQNEPECGTNKPSMKMDASSQANFIGEYLGPTLEKNGFGNIEIFCWDHNCDKKEYALEVLGNSNANKYVSGSAWHLYAGDIKILSEVYAEQPDKKLWLTEQWTGRDGEFAGDFKWHIKNVILGTLNNHGQAAFEWNLAADQNCDPHTLGGCPDCKGAITVNKKTNKVDSYNVSYYIIGQAAKFVRPGSVKIASKSTEDSLVSAAFETQEGKIVLIVLNDGNKEVDFKVKFDNNTITSKLNAGAAATYVW
jgi:glucosylceramidase